jgi:hypothetical protein
MRIIRGPLFFAPAKDHGKEPSECALQISYPEFAATQHLLHMGLQAVGKLKLKEPFEPQWGEVPLWLSSQGLTTGPIPYSGCAMKSQLKCLHQRLDLMSEQSQEVFTIAGVVQSPQYVEDR